jgi:3'-phosphoadenosine 5'-phosphosulfate (PAPS) 3'-phosphatase
LRVQRTIEYNLKKIFPSLDIQGEEDPSTYSHFDPCLQPSDLQRDLISQDFLNPFHLKRQTFLETMRVIYPEIVPKGSLFDSFDPAEGVVWIDPLDGTNDFVRGNLSAVTVLIGLSIGGVSRAGVVHSPFASHDQG